MLRYFGSRTAIPVCTIFLQGPGSIASPTFTKLKLSIWNDFAVCAQEIWVLAYYDGSSFSIRCKDANEDDANQIHPTEVSQWDCEDEDGDYTVLNAVETECGCPTPAPLTPSTSDICPEGGSFYVTAVWDDYDDLGTMNGCYEDSGHENFDAPEYFRGGQKADDQPVVISLEDDDGQVREGIVRPFSVDVLSTLDCRGRVKFLKIQNTWNCRHHATP